MFILTGWFCLLCGAAYLFLRIRVPKARTVSALQALILPASLLGLLLLITGTVFFFLSDDARHLARLPVTRSAAAIQAMDDGTKVVFEGMISPSLPTVYASYVAYVRSSEGRFERWTPRLRLELADGSVDLNNEDYEAMRWPTDRFAFGTYAYLQAGEAVTVSGEVERYVVIMDNVQEERVAIRAIHVFAGGHVEYGAAMRRRSIFPTIMSYVGWASGVGVAVFIPAAWLRRLLRERSGIEGGDVDGREG